MWRSKQSRALLDVSTRLTGRFLSAHVREDLSNVVVDDHCAVIGGGLALNHSKVLALNQQLSLERSLVIDVVVEVEAGDVDDDLACAAFVVGALTLLALDNLQVSIVQSWL